MSAAWRVCSGEPVLRPRRRSGAFGSGLAILSRHPILRTRTVPYLLCGLPIHVHHGDWIVAKAAGCATIALPQGDEVDVWVTHVSGPRAACPPLG